MVKLGFGGPPKLLPWEDVNVQAEQRRAIEGNEAVLPQLESTARRVNTFNQGEIQRMLELAMPGYAKLRDQGTQVISDFTAGKIPQDVRDAIGRNTAGRSLYGGFGGTGMSRNLTARDLGLTSLDLMTKGLDSATRWISMSRSLAPTMDVTSMFIRPEFQAQFAGMERDKRLGYKNVKRQFEYATDPMRGVENDVAGIADVVGTALMAYMGGGFDVSSMAGGMGGMGGAAGGGAGGGMMSGFGGMMGLGGGGGTAAAMQMFGGFGGMFGGGGGGGAAQSPWAAGPGY